MKNIAGVVILSLATVCLGTAHAADRYVAWDNATGASSPFGSWGAAATNIQDAVDASADGDTIWVAAGTYGLPTNHVVYGNTTNIVDIRKALTLRSFSGTPDDTIIQGDGKYRGLFLYPPVSTTILVDGFTVSNCWASADLDGGGGMQLFCNNSRTTIVQNCVIKDNKSDGIGGGATISANSSSSRTSYTLVSNCVFQGNQSITGPGGAIASRVRGDATEIITHCTIVSNWNTGGGWSGASAFHVSSAPANTSIRNCEIAYNQELGGGRAAIFVSYGTVALRNCFIHHNVAGGSSTAVIYLNGNNVGMTLESCAIALNTGNGVQFWDGTGQWLRTWNTLFYDDPPAIKTTALMTFTNCLFSASQGSITNGANNIFTDEPLFVDEANTNLHLLRWSPAVDAGTNQAWMSAADDLDGKARVSANNLVDIGVYETSFVAAPDHYVAQDGQTAQYPYTNWLTAASNIQEAVDASAVTDYGSNVWVAPGTYALPTNPVVYEGVTNVLDVRVEVNLRSLSGTPVDTIIDGEGRNRGVFLYPPAGGRILMDGFQIRNCWATNGAGMYLFGNNSRTTIVQNCEIRNNTTYGGGAGVYIGPDNTASPYIVLSNCVIQGNLTTNGTGAALSRNVRNGAGTDIITGCTIVSNTCMFDSWSATPGLNFSPAAPNTLIENCEVAYNVTPSGGRPAAVWLTGSITARNSLFHHNEAHGYYAAVFFVRANSNLRLQNCTVYDNVCRDVNVYNDNSSLTFDNTIIGYKDFSFSYPVLETYTNCSFPVAFTVTNGTDNLFTDDPQLLDPANDNYHLGRTSPCIDRGLSQGWMIGAVDLDGAPRIDGGGVDIGCYERVTYGTIITIQ